MCCWLSVLINYDLTINIEVYNVRCGTGGTNGVSLESVLGRPQGPPYKPLPPLCQLYCVSSGSSFVLWHLILTILHKHSFFQVQLVVVLILKLQQISIVLKSLGLQVERISSRMRFFVSCSLNYHYSHKPMRLVLSYANVSVGFSTHSNKHLTLGVLYREEVIAGNGMKNHISLSWKRRWFDDLLCRFPLLKMGYKLMTGGARNGW